MSLCIIVVIIPTILSFFQFLIKKESIKRAIVILLIPIAILSAGCLTGFMGEFSSYTDEISNYGEYDSTVVSMIKNYKHILPKITDRIDIINYEYKYSTNIFGDDCKIKLKVKCKDEKTMNELINAFSSEIKDNDEVELSNGGSISYSINDSEIKYIIITKR